MSYGEKKQVESTVASTRAAKRLFEQLFKATHGQFLHFESIIHSGECKWVVLFRRHVCIIPINASSDKKAISIPIGGIQSLTLDKNDNFLFADEEKTLKSAKVIIRYEEPQIEKKVKSGSTSPVRRFLSGRRGSAAAALEEASSNMERTVQTEGFYVFDDRTRVWINLHQMWTGNLIGQLYGWSRTDEMPENRVKELYVDLHKEIKSTKDIQERVDLLDELAHAARFSVCLKRCILLQAPSLLLFINAELRRFTSDKWRAQPEMQGLGRAEALQYLTVLLETLHKALYQCWPVFVGPEGEAEADKLLDPRTGVLVQMVQTLWLPFVLAEELRSKDAQAALEAMHSMMGVMYELTLLFSSAEARTYQEGGQVTKQQQLRYYICNAATDRQIERRVENLSLSLQAVLLRMPAGPYKTATAYHYAFVLNHLCCQSPSQISKAMAANHTEDLRFVLPGFISAELKASSHPLARRTVVFLQGLLHTFCPDVAPSTPKVVASAEGV